MELNQFIIIAAGLLIFSLLMLGAGIALFRNQGSADEERIAEEKRALQASTPDPPDRADREGQPQEGRPGESLEILRVARRPIDGGLEVETMGRTAGHASDLTPGQTEQLKHIIRELARWVEGRESRPGPADPAGSTASEPGAGSPPPPAAFADSLPRVPEPRDLLPFRRKNIPKLEEAPEPPKSIAAQIDAIIQDLLAEAPLPGGAIHLSEDPGGGLIIVHGSRTYQSIDEVEDEAARTLIKHAVQTWNERNRVG